MCSCCLAAVPSIGTAHLAAQGIASLRYDKRGCGQSAGAFLDASYFDFVADAVACLDWLKAEKRIRRDQLFLLGHSEGALTAMHVSLERSDVRGVIQLCPTVEDLRHALMKQARHMQELVGGTEDNDVVRKQERLIERVIAGLASPDEVAVHGIGITWLADILRLDVHGLYAQMSAAMLLIAGGKDVQCDATGVPGVAALTRASVQSHVLSDLTHVLCCDSERASLARYAELATRPIEPRVLTLISEWLATNLRECK